jgi:hypothetical protein
MGRCWVDVKVIVDFLQQSVKFKYSKAAFNTPFSGFAFKG